MLEIGAQGVPCFSGSCSEIYLERAFTSAGLGPDGRLVNAKTLGETSLMFLVHPDITGEQMDKVIEATREVVLRATQGC